MSVESSQLMAEIERAIAKGELTYEEMKRRVEEVIDAEASREDGPADLRLIDACEDLLWELETHGQQKYVSNKNEALRAFRKRMEEKEARRKTGRRNAERAAAIVAAVVVLTAAAGIALRREWLAGGSVNGGLQYQVTGWETDLGLIGSVAADGEQRQATLETADLAEAVSFLGFTPEMPAWLPEGWSVEKYFVLRNVESSRLSIKYFNPTMDSYIIFEAKFFININDAYSMFEQNEEGTYVVVNGQKVYYAENIEKIVCTWNAQNVIMMLTGPLDVDTSVEVIESIGGEAL